MQKMLAEETCLFPIQKEVNSIRVRDMLRTNFTLKVAFLKFQSSTNAIAMLIKI